MSKEEYLSIAESYYSDFESLKASSDFYDYEKSLAELMQKLSCSYMEKHLNEGSVTQDRRKKNSNPLWRNIHIEVPSIHERFSARLWHQPLHAGIDGLCRSS